MLESILPHLETEASPNALPAPFAHRLLQLGHIFIFPSFIIGLKPYRGMFERPDGCMMPKGIRNAITMERDQGDPRQGLDAKLEADMVSSRKP